MEDKFNTGLVKFIQRKFHSAIESFSSIKSSENKQEQILAYSYIGSCFIELSQYDKAIEILSEGLKINPHSFELNHKLGIALFKCKNFEEADKVFRTALISSSNSEERQKLIIWQTKASIELEQIKIAQMKKIGNIKFSNNWYQSDSTVVVSLDCNIPLNKVKCEILYESTAISVLIDTVKAYSINLSNKITPQSCTHKILSQKIELSLCKEVKGFNWITLDSQSANKVQSYPTSCKNKVDFSEIDKELNSEFKKDKPEGNDAMMKLFKEIYANADEETKRAMMKSYATSGGTVLSTNWKEVQEKDYSGKDRPTAPDGQQWADEKK